MRYLATQQGTGTSQFYWTVLALHPCSSNQLQRLIIISHLLITEMIFVLSLKVLDRLFLSQRQSKEQHPYSTKTKTRSKFLCDTTFMAKGSLLVVLLSPPCLLHGAKLHLFHSILMIKPLLVYFTHSELPGKNKISPNKYISQALLSLSLFLLPAMHKSPWEEIPNLAIKTNTDRL